MIQHAIATLCFFLVVFFQGYSDALAQSSADVLAKNHTEDRLKAIYEKGEFWGKQHEGTWLPDSSGYTVQEFDPESEELKSVLYDAKTGARMESKPVDENEIDTPDLLSPDGKRRLEIRNRNLLVRDLETDKRTQLTTRFFRDIWIRKPRWSPNGKHVLYIEFNDNQVKTRSMLVPSDPTYPSIRKQRFARVGEQIPSLRVGVVDADGKNRRWLPIESPKEGFYLGQVDWVGDEIVVEKLSRFRDRREILLFNRKGKSKKIFQDSNHAWGVSSQGKNSGLTWLRDGQEFIVISEKDGWRHAYLYSRDGKELSRLTVGDYDMIDRAVVDEAGGWYYFYASPDNATEKYLFRVPLDGSAKLEQITPKNQPGTHEYQFSPDKRWAIHSYSTFDSPPIFELIEVANHRVVKLMEDNAELREKTKVMMKHPTEFIQLEIGNGVTMDAWLIKPNEFDETKKYPVFIYVYGEPHAQTVLNQWGAGQSEFMRVIADLGYLVASIDNRGTPAPKGAAWRRAIFKSLGPLSTTEQAAGLKELGRLKPYVDLSRVGIWGWSGGGSNTLNSMFRQPDDYHVGIAVAPKPQPHLYNAWFQEIYMRTREVNPDGYQQAAPINFADGLKGKLLIVAGSGETNTHIQIVEGLVDRLIELGKQFDYMVYPHRDHSLNEGTGTIVHVRMLIARYLVEHLRPGPM